MTEILEILKYIIPALIVFITAYFSIRYFIKHDQKLKKMELVLENQKLITPIRLQAYERLTLFLERISPQSMIMRTQKPNMTCKQLQTKLLSTIRSEFEHNLSQQVYISNKAWEVIKNSKENTVKIINSASGKLKPNAPAMELSKNIIETIFEINKSPSQIAIEYLKNEIRQLF
ncbi:MAG: hypothetical protein KAT68_00020 [Bacteroidales bacterium]|nr:hypothetical protein [Bacteroidales bacterium]